MASDASAKEVPAEGTERDLLTVSKTPSEHSPPQVPVL